MHAGQAPRFATTSESRLPCVTSVSAMEFRQLGKSGLKVPVLSYGTGTFGGGTEFFKAWGASDVAEATRLVDICLDAGVNLFDTADVYSNGLVGNDPRKSRRGRRDKVLISTKATFKMGEGPNDLGSSRHHLIHACEASLRRLGTDYIDIYHLHGFDALTPVEEVLSTLDNLMQEREGALHRVLELFRMAFDEVASRLGSLRLGALCRASGVLLADWPRVRMGTDAARAGSGSGSAGLESAGMGAADRKDSPRAAAAASKPTASRRPIKGRRSPDEYLYSVVDALDEVAKETGKTVPQIALNWLLQRPTVSTVIMGARNEEAATSEPGCGRMESAAPSRSPSSIAPATCRPFIRTGTSGSSRRGIRSQWLSIGLVLRSSGPPSPACLDPKVVPSSKRSSRPPLSPA